MQLRKLDLKRGDTIVFEAPSSLSLEQAKRLTDLYGKQLTELGVKAIVVSDGMKVAKVVPGKK